MPKQNILYFGADILLSGLLTGIFLGRLLAYTRALLNSRTPAYIWYNHPTL